MAPVKTLKMISNRYVSLTPVVSIGKVSRYRPPLTRRRRRLGASTTTALGKARWSWFEIIKSIVKLSFRWQHSDGGETCRAVDEEFQLSTLIDKQGVRDSVSISKDKRKIKKTSSEDNPWKTLIYIRKGGSIDRGVARSFFHEDIWHALGSLNNQVL